MLQLNLLGDLVSIVGAGTTEITALQTGNNLYFGATPIKQVLLVSKRVQTISFNPITSVAINQLPITLHATASSGLNVSFSSINAVTITGTSVSANQPGMVTIVATQTGNAIYSMAVPVSQTFCIKPNKPTIEVNETDAGQLLNSSSVGGNQWFKDGNAISNQNSSTLLVTESGNYTVQVEINECFSDLSDEAIVVITGIESSATGIELFPNPALDKLFIISSSEADAVRIVSTTGTVIMERPFQGDKNGQVLSISGLPAGVYLLELRKAGIVQIRGKFLKR
jgi:hypothetical protein